MTRSLEFARRVAGAPETAFSYFVDPDKHVLWQGVRAELDPVPGGRYVVHYTERTRLRGRYLEVDPPRRLVLAWGAETTAGDAPEALRQLGPGSTRVEITFTPDGDGTIIRVVHSDLPGEEAAGLTSFGWTTYLERIAVVSEGRDPGDDLVSAAIREMMGT